MGDRRLDSEQHLNSLGAPDWNREVLPPILRAWRKRLLNANKREKTVSSYMDSVLKFLKFCEVKGFPGPEHVTADHVSAWIEEVQATVKPYSVRHYFVEVRLFFDWLQKVVEERADNPFAGMPIPQVDETQKDVVNIQRMGHVLRELRAQKRYRDLVLVALIYDTGMRAGEVARAMVADFDFDKDQITITGANTKNRKIRYVWVSPDLSDMIARYHRQRERDNAPGREFLVSGRVGGLTRSGVTQTVEHIFREFGVEHITPHDLRHTSASHAALSGMPEAQMDQIYGWSPKSGMSRHYTRQVQTEMARKAHQEHSPLKGLGL